MGQLKPEGTFCMGCAKEKLMVGTTKYFTVLQFVALEKYFRLYFMGDR